MSQTDVHTLALSGGALDTLVSLVEMGPLWDGDVPSKQGRDELLMIGFACRVVVKGEDGFQAATYRGRDAYLSNFGCARSIAEARAYRLAQRAIGAAR